jgi:hypothetical protein
VLRVEGPPDPGSVMYSAVIWIHAFSFQTSSESWCRRQVSQKYSIIAPQQLYHSAGNFNIITIIIMVIIATVPLAYYVAAQLYISFNGYKHYNHISIVRRRKMHVHVFYYFK